MRLVPESLRTDKTAELRFVPSEKPDAGETFKTPLQSLTFFASIATTSPLAKTGLRATSFNPGVADEAAP